MVRDVRSEGGQDCPIKALDLTIRLRMVGRSERVVYHQDFADVLEKPGCKLTPVVRYEFGRWAVGEYPFVHECLCHGRSGDASKEYGSNQLGEPIGYYEEPSISSRGLSQFAQYVDAY